LSILFGREHTKGVYNCFFEWSPAYWKTREPVQTASRADVFEGVFINEVLSGGSGSVIKVNRFAGLLKQRIES